MRDSPFCSQLEMNRFSEIEKRRRLTANGPALYFINRIFKRVKSSNKTRLLTWIGSRVILSGNLILVLYVSPITRAQLAALCSGIVKFSNSFRNFS
ncbi:hypothetical protein J2X61_005997 [Bacillus sp. 3255]|nr:hypothetical protein [Bacillus sp. 3255]